MVFFNEFEVIHMHQWYIEMPYCRADYGLPYNKVELGPFSKPILSFQEKENDNGNT